MSNHRVYFQQVKQQRLIHKYFPVFSIMTVLFQSFYIYLSIKSKEFRYCLMLWLISMGLGKSRENLIRSAYSLVVLDIDPINIIHYV